MREKNFLDESDKNDLTTWTKWLFTLILLTHNFAENGLTSDDTGAWFSAAMGMNVLAGSAVMSLTLIWPSVIAFGSYDLAVDNDTTLPHIPGEEPSFIKKLSGCYISLISYTEYKQPNITSQTYGVTTDSETSHTARIMLVSMIPFVILQLPKIINVTTVTREIVLLTLILTSAFFIGYAVYQIFQPWIQNRRFDYIMQKFVKNKLLKLLSTNGKTNVQLIKDLHQQLDKNHDGKVTHAELKTLLLGIHLQADGELSDDLVERIIEKFDFNGDHCIQEDEFVTILTKWLQEARKSLSENDYNPLRIFKRSQKGADEEQLPLIPKKKNFNDDGLIWEYLKALALVLSGTVVTALIALPLIMNVSGFATDANIPSFLIPYVIIPCAINIPRLLSTINSAGHKTQRAVSLTLSQIYSGVFMSNMSSLTTFLLTVYIRDLPWDVSAEVLVVLIICGVMGIFTSTRTIFPLWTGYLGYMLYPTSLLMLYLFTNVWGWP
ncbi:putative EF-hand domain-containing protein [Helianthus annuus]|nr:putative EF-hand domain-containing protein [Helianthus annuus]KAJ0758272.1 putative EF-hand domain-containing protein [Helianthus annuus]KAJ0761933.1 putative EF-hand domain-containing protein [Helianthus annuus]